ncbi:hypothetical protein GGR56DRAFT_695354 [Xylariaceae sp. FL0804]|nr:hypothetical protein GGR56DRAFT_695354 [Xylariaceae sp. FL0804]
MGSELIAESWTWYTLTWTIVLARLGSRITLFGSVKKLQIDDALMVLAMITDTVLVASMNILSHTNSNLIDPNNPVELTPEEISERAYGSKLVLVVEQMQILTIWLVKACLLIMYMRIIISKGQRLAARITAGYVLLGFVVMETQLPLKKKAILCGVFALGIFTILSAVLNKFYSFTEPFGSSWTFWYIRESSTALITANLPYTWTLFQRVFHLRSFNGRSSNDRSTNPTYNNKTRTNAHRSTAYGSKNIYGHGHQTTIMGGSGEDAEYDDVMRSDSQERINKAFELKIYKQQEKVRATTQLSTPPVQSTVYK